MYGLLIFTLLSFTIGSISTETENVEVVPVNLKYDESRFVGTFIRPLEDLQIIQVFGFSEPSVLNITFHPNDPTSYNSVTISIVVEEIFCVQINIMLPWLGIVLNNKKYSQQSFPYPLSEYKMITVETVLHVYLFTQLIPFPNIKPVCIPKHFITGADATFQTYFSTTETTILKPGQIITVIGKSIPAWSTTVGRFSINFTGKTEQELLLHFNPRFDERTIALNDFNGSSWGQQETITTFPFQHNQLFKLVFGLTERSFKFAVNGIYLGTFNYRQNNVLDILSGFYVDATDYLDVSIFSVDYIQTGSPNVDNIAKLSEW